MPVDWDGLTWEAFATLVTGALAVIAAVIIGLRQTTIAHKQLGINQAQVDLIRIQSALQRTTLRHDLFDRRSDVHAATLALVRAHGFFANPYTEEELRKVEMDFRRAVQQSGFLFHSEVADALKKIHFNHMHIGVIRRMIAENRPEPDQTIDELRKQVEALDLWFVNQEDHLPHLFREMNLGEEL